MKTNTSRHWPHFGSRQVSSSESVIELKGRVLAAKPAQSERPENRVERARVLLASLRTAGFEPQTTKARSAHATRAVEPATPVGSATFVDNSSMQANWGDIASFRAVANPEALAFDDATVKNMVSTFFSSTLSVDRLGRVSPSTLVPDWATMLRNFVRAAELGLRVTVNDQVWLLPWPNTPEAAALLRRAAKAFDVSEDSIRFAKGTLAQPNLLAGQPEIVDGVEVSAPVGTDSFSGNIQTNWNAFRSQQPVPDPNQLCFNDATVAQAVTWAASNQLYPGYLLGPDPRVAPDALWIFRNFIRTAELGTYVSVTPEVWQIDWPTTPEMAALLRRAARAFKVDPANIRFGEQTLATYDPQKARFRGPAEAEPSAPVGNGTFDGYSQSHHQSIAANREVSEPLVALQDGSATRLVTEFFRNTLHGAYLGAGSLLAPQGLTQFRNFIRAAELGTKVTVMPDVWTKDWPATEEVARLLLRAAAAFKVDETTIMLGGRPLSEVRRGPRPEAFATTTTKTAIDLPGSLRSMYPSLQVGRWLGQHDLLASGVADFVRRLGLPEDVVPLAFEAVGVTDIAPGQGSPGTAPTRSYRERRRSNDDQFEGFSVASGPLTTESGELGQYQYRYQLDPGQFFRYWASDENLASIASYGGFDVNGWAHSMQSGAYVAQPEEVISFTARRLELQYNQSNAQQTRSTLENGYLAEQFKSDACVPALLRLAKACAANIDTVRVNDGSTLRQRATDLGLFAPPPTDTDVHEQLAAMTQDITDEWPASKRVETLAQLMGPTLASPSLAELMSALVPLVGDDQIKPVTYETEYGTQLMAALTAERHPLAVAALAGVFLEPTPEALAALHAMLQDWSADEREAMENRITQFHALSPESKAFALESLAESPPELSVFEARIAVSSTRLAPDALATLYQETHDPAQMLQALVALAKRTQGTEAVTAFLAAGVSTRPFNPVDLREALGETPASDVAKTEVLLAVEALASSDPVTRETAMQHVREAVAKYALEASPDDLISEALMVLYQRDLDLVAPLGEVEAAGDPVKAQAFKDGRTVAQRLGGADVGAQLAELEPELCAQLKGVKMRVELQQMGADADAFAEAALAEGQRWLKSRQELGPSKHAAVLKHLEAWALSH
jgi:hypothetical protein